MLVMPTFKVPPGLSASDIIARLVGARPLLDPELLASAEADLLDGAAVAGLFAMFGLLPPEPPREEELVAARARLRDTIARLDLA